MGGLFGSENMCDSGIIKVLESLNGEIKEKLSEFLYEKFAGLLGEDRAYSLAGEFEEILDREVNNGTSGIFSDAVEEFDGNLESAIDDARNEAITDTKNDVEEWYTGRIVEVHGKKLTFMPGRSVFVDTQLRRAFRLVEADDMIVSHDISV